MVKKEALFVDKEALRVLGLEERLSHSDLPKEVIEAIRVNGDLTKYLTDCYTQSMAEREELKTELFELKQQYAQMEESYQQKISALEGQVIRDGLTGAYNRRHLDQQIPKEISRAQRHDKDLSLALFDLDKFKAINDNYGHQAGDYVLSRFADVVQETIRAGDLLCRYGGEEFVLILPDTEQDQAALLAERIRKEVESAEFRYNGESLPVTVSIGTSQYLAGEDNDALLGRADKALYHAKETGRNKVVTS